MERHDDKKCIYQCVVRLHDTALVYAGLDERSYSFYAFFLHLFHAGADLSGTAVITGNPARLFDSVILDCFFVLCWNVALEKGTKKACCAGWLD